MSISAFLLFSSDVKYAVKEFLASPEIQSFRKKWETHATVIFFNLKQLNGDYCEFSYVTFSDKFKDFDIYLYESPLRTLSISTKIFDETIFEKAPAEYSLMKKLFHSILDMGIKIYYIQCNYNSFVEFKKKRIVPLKYAGWGTKISDNTMYQIKKII